jgi:two-component system, LytTR family, sensor kinase
VETSPRTYIPLRDVNWRIVISFFGFVLICLFFYKQLDFVANGEARPPLLTFLEEAAGSFAGFTVFPVFYLAAIRFPLISPDWRRNLAIHLAVVCLLSCVHTTVIAGLRPVLFALFGFHQSYGYLPWRYPMEFAHFFMFYWIGLSVVYLFHQVRFAREREIRQAKLETSLAETQLQNLRLQLEPHFLFNALNAISAAIYESPRVADEMVGWLGDLLRQVLKSDRSQEVTLAREIELLQLYTRIMEARLEHRLKLTISVDESAKQALVPQLIFQPLVENAIRHGMDPITFGVDVCLQARREDGRLHLTIRDHGPGLDSPAALKTGIGLNNTTTRLLRLYGDQQSFAIHNAEGGGVVVDIYLPYRAQPNEQPLLQETPISGHALT